MMATTRQELRTAQIFPDGEGGFVLKGILPDGAHVVFPLTAERALHLLKGCADALLDLSKDRKQA